MKEKKSQTSIEFMLFVGFMMIFFGIFFLLIQEKISEKLNEKQNNLVKELALTVQNEINLAVEARDGYFRKFNLPDNLGGQNYQIEIVEQMVYVKTDKHAIALPVAEVNGQIEKGENWIKKENGEIHLN